MAKHSASDPKSSDKPKGRTVNTTALNKAQQAGNDHIAAERDYHKKNDPSRNN